MMRRSSCALRTLTFPKRKVGPTVANELFEIQTKTCINNSLQTIDLLLDQDPTQARDDMIHEQVRLIRELVGLTQYVRSPTAERVYDRYRARQQTLEPRA
jgi:hypothetical protein